jgi:ring-1,2-phenylacetyl-CoA epoxidase subunit PaaE
VAPRVFHPLTVSEVRRETADTVSIRLDVPTDLTETFRFAPGQFLTFRVPGTHGQPVTRSFSICSGLDDGELRVLVKSLPGGVFGERANTTMQPGEVLETVAPQGRFTVPIDPVHVKRYLGLAAGSGISPVISLIRTLLAREPHSTFTLLYGNRGQASIIFRDALAELKDRYLDRLQVIHVFSQERQSTELFNGRLTDAKLRELNHLLVPVAGFDDAFVCGPEPMTISLRETLIDLGMKSAHVHLELYGSHGAGSWKSGAPRPTAEQEGNVRLTITLGGVTSMIDAARSDRILDAAAGAGLDVPFSCTGGVCATCRARVVEGGVEMAVNYALQQWELEAGFTLTCQARPTTDAATIDYDAV